MNKKFIAVLAAMTLTASAGAVNAAYTIDEQSQNIVLSGYVPADYVGLGTITIMIKDGNTIAYVDEADITDGKYFKKFKYTGDISDCTLSVKAGNEDITSGVLTAEAHTDAFEGTFELVGSGANRFFDTDDTVQLRASIQNVWADPTTLSLFVASYDENGMLIGAKKIDKQLEYGEDGKAQVISSEDYTVPENAVTVKGFAWKDDIKPLITSEAQNTGDKLYQDGDRVAFIGDSITHIGIYPEFIEHYYQTKNPENDYYFYNKGVSGQEAANILNRLESDIFAYDVNRVTIMMGVNDISGRFNSSTATDETKQAAIDRSVGYFEQIIQKCQEKGVEIAIITPMMYDEDESLTGKLNAGGLNSGLIKMTSQLKALGEQYGIAVYDANTIENEIVSEARANGVTGEIIASNDRTHPTRYGDTIIGYAILKEQGADGLVASTEINAEASTADAQNAEISDISFTADGGTFTYAPKAIPLAYNSWYKGAEKLVPTLTDELNCEMIKVSGLISGDYTVSLNGTALDRTYTADELANGINIATLSQNPNQAKAAKSHDILVEKNSYTSKLRGIVLAETFGASPDVYSSEAKLAAYKAKFTGHVYQSVMLSYPDRKPYENDYKNELEELRKAAKEATQPTVYTVSVVKN